MIRLFLTPINIAICTLLVLAALVGVVLIPAGAVLPVHWGLDGQPDAWQGRDLALAFPLILAGLIAVLLVLIRRYGNRGRAEAGIYVLRAALTAILVLALGIEVATVLIGIGYPISMVQVVSLCIAVLLLLLGNAMPKSQPNSFAGIRIPSTLNDPANWQATHRLTGLLLLVGGVVLAVAAFLVPPGPVLLAVLLAAILVPIVIGVVYSLRLARHS